MFHNAIPALILSAGILNGVPPMYGVGGPPLYRMIPSEFVRPPPPPPRFFPQAPVGGGCLSPGEARAAVQNGEVIALSSVLGQIRQSAGGQIVSVPALCNMGGRLVYFLDVLTAGRIMHLQVDARTGRIGP